jgi:16S rRNA (cytosine1402-N4)-methyltransferase
MHIPVLTQAVADLLRSRAGGIYFDGTVGLGGHSALLLEACTGTYVYGTDKDSEAMEIARKNLEAYKDRFTLLLSDFKKIDTLPLEIAAVDGFLFDLGVSSYQLDNPARGFSYAQNAPLDMRMDKNQRLSAYQVVNDYSYDQLSGLLRTYGEFENPGKIVQQIVYHRKTKKIEDTGELRDLVRKIYPRQKTMDPLSRIFQAIRIEVNRELTGLDTYFQALIKKMKPGARIVIISFHSLEDRIVKSVFKKAREEGGLTILTRKPVIAAREEIQANPRARSAKLRAAEKTAAPAISDL